MKPGGHYPSPGFIIAGCLTVIAAGCTVAIGYLAMILAH